MPAAQLCVQAPTPTTLGIGNAVSGAREGTTTGSRVRARFIVRDGRVLGFGLKDLNGAAGAGGVEYDTEEVLGEEGGKW